MATEDSLAEAHKRAAKVVGQLSLTLARRSLRGGFIVYWIKELRQAADILEQLIPERVNAGKKEISRD